MTNNGRITNNDATRPNDKVWCRRARQKTYFCMERLMLETLHDLP